MALKPVALRVAPAFTSHAPRIIQEGHRPFYKDRQERVHQSHLKDATNPHSFVHHFNRFAVQNFIKPLPPLKKPTAHDAEDYRRMIVPVRDIEVEKERAYAYGFRRVERLREFITCLSAQGHFVEIHLDDAGNPETPVKVVNLKNQRVTEHTSVNRALMAYGIQSKIQLMNHFVDYEVSPYESAHYRPRNRALIRWDETNQKITVLQNAPDFIGGNLMATLLNNNPQDEESFVTLMGAMLRAQDAILLKGATQTAHFPEITNLGFDEYVRKNRIELDVIPSHSQGDTFSIVSQPTRVLRSFVTVSGDEKKAEARDQVRALLRMQNALMQLGEQRVRSTRVYVIGPDFYIRERVMPYMPRASIDQVRRLAPEMLSNSHAEFQAIGQLLTESYSNLHIPGNINLVGHSLETPNDPSLVIYDPYSGA